MTVQIYRLTLENDFAKEAAEIEIMDADGLVTLNLDGEELEGSFTRLQDGMRAALGELAEEMGLPWTL